MLTIRLQRTGRENIPFYSVVVAEHARPVKSKFIEKLGTYNPLIKPWALVVDTAKIEAWIKKGAKPSSTLARLLKSQGLKDMDRYIKPMKDRKKKSEASAEASSTKPSSTKPSSAKASEAPASEAPASEASAPAAPTEKTA